MSASRTTRCGVCRSAARAQVEFELSRHVPIRRIAARHGLTRNVVFWHYQHHMSEPVKRALRQKSLLSEVDLANLRVEESTNLLERLVWQRAKLHGLLAEAERDNDVRAAVMVHREIGNNLALTGKLLGEFVTHDRVINQNLVVSPDYLRLRQGLLQALYSYPEARRAVVEVLKRLEAGAPIGPDVPALPVGAEHEPTV